MLMNSRGGHPFGVCLLMNSKGGPPILRGGQDNFYGSNDIYLSTCYRIMIKNFGSYRVDCPGGVRRNIFAKDTKHLSTLFMKRKHERNKHFQFSTGLYLQVLATRESNNNFRTNLVDRKESFAYIH